MNESVSHRVREIVASILGAEPDALTDQSSPDDLDEWDSFAQLNILVALEDEFSVQLSPDDIDAMQNVGAIVELVASRVG